MATQKKNTVVPEQEPVEDRRQKFIRLGRSRVNRALTAIRLISNLASYNYQWTQKDIKLIRNTLHGAIDDMLQRFERIRHAPVTSFDFDEEEPDELGIASPRARPATAVRAAQQPRIRQRA